ncbi:MAG: hypothetical protein GY853_14970 [PVC group bacterium]|nr:hypothetical protein [PVC group bacterium]
MISDDTNHVYKSVPNISLFREGKRLTSYKKESIYKPFTFLGFCKKHDKYVFKPIDDYPLKPTDQQVCLYAYRSLCKAYFEKENSMNTIDSVCSDETTASGHPKEVFKRIGKSAGFGFENFKRHKKHYDESLKNDRFYDVNYVLFHSKQKPNVAFSGWFWPEFDFLGRRLQNLADHSNELELITFCSAPLEEGWGYLFAWHYTSDRICNQFISSLATKVYEGDKMGDLLFRLLISYCDNYAFSPKWWEALPSTCVEAITERASWLTSPFCGIKPTYLQEGLKGIVMWDFYRLLDKRGNKPPDIYEE